MSTVFIDNLSEDVWQFIESLASSDVRRAEIGENSALSDRNYLGLSAEFPDGIKYFAPEAIDATFADYVNSLFGGIKPTVLTPRNHRGQLSEDILNEPRLLKELGAIRDMILISYCSSRPFYRLINKLRLDYGVNLTTPEAPALDRWQVTVNTYGTKAGLRQVLAKESGILGKILPKGEIAQGKAEIVAATTRIINHQRGVVIKTNKGHAGMGVVVITPTEVKLYRNSWEKYVLSRLEASNGFWEMFPVVVETYIPTDKTIAGGFPNVECRINHLGQVEILYVCGMRLHNCVFAGLEAYDGLLPSEYQQQVLEIGTALGNQLAARGYRGYFDIDFMVDISGKLYISELNVRRTGGTWAISVCERLFGKSYGTGRYIATNLVHVPKLASRSFEQVRQVLCPVLLGAGQGDEQGVILASSNLVAQEKLQYLLVAKDKDNADKLEQNILRLLEE